MIILKSDSIDDINYGLIAEHMKKIESDKEYNTYDLGAVVTEIKNTYGLIVLLKNNVTHFKRNLEQEFKDNIISDKENIMVTYISAYGKQRKILKRELRYYYKLEDVNQGVYEEKNNNFVWYILETDCFTRFNIENLYRKKIQQFLLLSPSTILLDIDDTYISNIKKLDFPSLCDTKMFLNKKVIENIILLPTPNYNSVFACDIHIIEHYMNKKYKYLKNSYVITSNIYIYLDLYARYGYTSFKKDIYITENIKKRCYISYSPIFGPYVEFTLEWKTNKTLNSKTIYVSKFLMNQISCYDYLEGRIFSKTLVKIFKSRNNITSNVNIIKIRDNLYSDTYELAIKKMNTSDEEKYLLLGLLEYGCVFDKNKFYIINTQKNKLFMGVSCITDALLLEYAQTDTILFQY